MNEPSTKSGLNEEIFGKAGHHLTYVAVDGANILGILPSYVLSTCKSRIS